MSTSETGSIKDLSEREIEILRQVATGATSKEIGQQLYITENTVKVHLRNVFAKIGVTTRTEAALWAVRNGLVTIPVAQGDEGRGSTKVEAATTAAGQLESPQASLQSPARARGWSRRAIPVIVALTILLVGLGLITNSLRQSSPTLTLIPPTAPSRWQAKADMPTARSGLAVATYENQLYAIGGRTREGVTDRVERYDPATNTWAVLKPKPTAVTDVNAAVIGGQIYIPSGRLASGDMTDVLESYDPRRDQWEERAPLPVALSGYALVAFEGRLYLFGGWDGKEYQASVYEYDPSRDLWTERTPMLTARSFAGAAVAGGRIYVIGGMAGEKALAVNEEYVLERDTGGGNPWTPRAPMPEARFAMGIASIADIIHVVGGEGSAETLHALEYFPQSDEWQVFEFPVTQPWRGPGVGVVETSLHTFGGVQASAPTTQHLVYQAIYTVFIPVVR